MTSRRIAYACVLIAGIIAFTVAIWACFTQYGYGGGDFVPLWLGARALLFEHRSPYDAVVARQAQEMILGGAAAAGRDQLAFAYPLPALLPVLPMAWLPFDWAQAAWLTLSLAMALISVLTLVRPARAAAFALACALAVLFYPDARSLALGQFAVLSISALILTVSAVERGRPVAAGALLVLACLKPQTSFLIAPALVLYALRKRQFTVLGGAAAAGTALLGATLVWWPTWPAEWLNRLMEYSGYARKPSVLAMIAGDMAPVLIIASLVIAAIVALRVDGLRKIVTWEVALTLLAAPVTSMSEQMLLLLPIGMALRGLSLPAQFALVLAAISGPWVWFGLSAASGREATIMIVPLPLILLGVLLLRAVGGGRSHLMRELRRRAHGTSWEGDGPSLTRDEPAR
jgi:hypothetical protein